MIRLAVLLALATPLAAHAKSHQPKVMVLDLTHDAALSPAEASTLDGFVAGAVRDQGFQVITPSQVGAVLGVERQRQLLGCSESSCLAEIGGALGVDYIVQGSVALFSKSSAITLTLIDGTKGVAVGSQQKSVEGRDPGNFIPVIQAMVPRLMSSVKAAPNLTQAPSKPAEEPVAQLGTHEVSQTASAGHPTGAYVLLGTGVALLAGSLVTGLLAKSAQSRLQADVNDPTRASAVDGDRSSAKNLAMVSTVALGVGLAGTIGGGAWWLTSGGSEGEQ